MAKDQVTLEYDAAAEADALLREEDENLQMHKINGNSSEANTYGKPSLDGLEELEQSEGLPPPATMAVNAVRELSPSFPHSEISLTQFYRLRKFIPLRSSV